MENNADASSDVSKMSAHAKRRLQKKLKKQMEQKDEPGQSESSAQPEAARPAEQKVQKVFKTKQVREPAGQAADARGDQNAKADAASDKSMTDESKQQPSQVSAVGSQQVQEEEKQGARNESGKGKASAKRAQKDGAAKGPHKAFLMRDKDKPVKTREDGFTGQSDTWFDDERYKKPKVGATFDEANQHDYYYNSYSSHHIHEEMLKDQHRTLTYQRAIEGNPQDFKDKIVLDIGCGTGILSIFAARAGAKHVYAIDNAEIALFAKDIVKDNGLESKITVYKGKMEELDLPFGEGEVDIIVSEWMGYFLLYESMLDCVLWARDKYLNKKTGKMLPDRAQMYVAAIEDSEYMADKQHFWKSVYGVNMSCMTNGIFTDPMVDVVPSANIMSDSCCILDLDLVKMQPGDVEFANCYSLKMQYTDKVHALVSWFDTSFSQLTNPVVLTTSPMKKSTHWKQSVFYLERPLSVRKGDDLSGSIACRKDRTNFRELNIKASYHINAPQCKYDYDQQYKFK